MEELWQLLADSSNSAENVSPGIESDSSDELMSISLHVVSGVTSGKIIKLQAYIHELKALVLIDSSSSHSFVSEQLATYLPFINPFKKSINGQVADGGIITCTHEVVNCASS